LDAFLKSLKNLNRGTISIDYMFVDDNVDENSSKLLAEFERDGSTVINIWGKDQGFIYAMMKHTIGMTILCSR